MGLFHLANCIALATGPHYLVYKSAGIKENDAFWICCKAAVIFGLTQLLKFFLATLAPLNDASGVLDWLFYDVLGIVIELVVIYLIVRKASPRNEINIIAFITGWSQASLICTKYIPIWFGTKGLEFNWEYLYLSFDANLELLLTFVAFYSFWLLCRRSGSLASSLLGVVLLMFVLIKAHIFAFLMRKTDIFVATIIKTFLCVTLGLLTMVLRSMRDMDKLESREFGGIIEKILRFVKPNFQQNNLRNREPKTHLFRKTR